MTPDPNIAAALQRLNTALEHPRTLAREAIAERRSRSETLEPTIPWVEARPGLAPLLDRDAVLARTQPNHAPRYIITGKRPWWRRLLMRG